MDWRKWGAKTLVGFTTGAGAAAGARYGGMYGMAAGGAAGNLAGQVLSKQLGLQDDIDWTEVAINAAFPVGLKWLGAAGGAIARSSVGKAIGKWAVGAGGRIAESAVGRGVAAAGRWAYGRANSALNAIVHDGLGQSSLKGLRGLHDPVAGFFNKIGFRVCFVAGTPLLTPDGAKAIEDFKVGDWLLSRDEYNVEGPVEPKVVEEVFRRYGPVLYLMVGGQRVGTTHEHPFWVRGKGWLPAQEVIIGDHLLSHDGQWVVVNAREDSGEWAAVYNLRIADYHTYFVGCDEWGFSVWAHNADCAKIAEDLTAGRSKLGAVVGEGGFGRVHEIEGHPGLVAKIVKATDGAPNAQLVAEAQNLQRLKDTGVPVAYQGIIEWTEGGVARQAIVMDQVDGFLSKQVLGVGKFAGETPTAEMLGAVTPRTLQDLRAFKDTVMRNNINIEDIQFMISRIDGSIRVIDPARMQFVAETQGLHRKQLQNLINASMESTERRLNNQIRLFERIAQGN
jgi:hypothetical protein